MGRGPSTRRDGSPLLDGLAVVDKASGWTSHDVVAKCRGIFGQKRVGHSGTLDPDATGVLLIGLGRVTKLLRFLTALPKTYTAEVVLGVATTTLDSSGTVVGEWDMSAVTMDEARAAAATLTGDIQQVPPMVSAVSIGGQRLHQLARKGIEVERAARPVTVHRFDVAPDPAGRPGILVIEIECSSGTYVRSLAADLGAALGGGAHLRALRRTAIGSFGSGEARPVEALDTAAILDPVAALRDYAAIEVGPELAARVANGAVLAAADLAGAGVTGAGPWPVVCEGRLLAVYEQTETGGGAKPAVVVPPPPPI